jgi:predicted RecB family nuclease
MQKQDEKAGSLPPTISAPAMRVLENNGIKTLQQLSKHTGAAILKLHGIEKTAIPVLQKALKEKDLALRLKKSV